MGYYSQDGEDRWIVENLPLPEKGIFVEVGANDGRDCSNTLCFEEQGWTGLCIEPDPRCFRKLRENRKCALATCAIGKPGVRLLGMCGSTMLSGLNRPNLPDQVPVGAVTLDAVLDNNGISHVDLLSIDTEGTEIEVWNTLTFERFKPNIVIVETYTIGIGRTDNIILAEFAKYPMKMMKKTKMNMIFVRNEWYDAALAERSRH